MKKAAILALCLLPLAAIADESGAPSALVRTVRLAEHAFDESVTGYGVVLPDPDETVSINPPRAGQVVHLFVRRGQVVKAGAPLFELDTNPEARMRYLQASAAVDFAKTELSRKEHLFASQLATRADVAQAKKALADAQATLAAQSRIGAGRGHERFSAPFDGIVSSVAVSQGDRIQTGQLVLNLTRRTSLIVALGVEPEDAARVKAGQPVDVAPVFDPSRRIHARVHEVHGMVNPTTRLVDVLIRLDAAQVDGLLPGMRMRGRIVLGTSKHLAVPRAAILWDAKGAYVYRVKDGHAERVGVQPGLDDGNLTEILGSAGLKVGDAIVRLGNYELTDGMAVREASR